MDILITPRLTIRPLLEVDADALVAHLNDPKVTCNLRPLPKPYRLEDARDFLKIFDEDETRRGYVIARERAIGMIGFHHYDARNKTAHLGYWLASNHHGKGYMTEALNKILHTLFAENWVETVKSDVFEGNDASRKLQEKLGFIFEGTQTHNGRVANTSHLTKAGFEKQILMAA